MERLCLDHALSLAYINLNKRTPQQLDSDGSSFLEERCHIDDWFMSVIHSCQFCAANPLNYLTELENDTEELAPHPEQWIRGTTVRGAKPCLPRRSLSPGIYELTVTLLGTVPEVRL
jgi:hypothetical protein